MVFSSRSGSKSKSKQKKGADPGAEPSSSTGLFGPHSPLRRHKPKPTSASQPIPISGPSSNLLELPPGAGTSSASTPSPSQFAPPTRAEPPEPPAFLPLCNGRERLSDSPLPSPWVEEALAAKMAFEFSPHQLDTLKDAFNFFDIDRDGRITCSELQSVFKFLGSPVTADQVELMISEADIDGNGTVELNEFLRMMKRYYHKHEMPSTEEEEMLEAFKAFDHNGDSFIDFDEIKKTMHFLGEAVSDEEVRAMIREADADKDGRINFEEFKKMMSLMRTGPPQPGGAAGASK